MPFKTFIAWHLKVGMHHFVIILPCIYTLDLHGISAVYIHIYSFSVQCTRYFQILHWCLSLIKYCNLIYKLQNKSTKHEKNITSEYMHLWQGQKISANQITNVGLATIYMGFEPWGEPVKKVWGANLKLSLLY